MFYSRHFQGPLLTVQLGDGMTKQGTLALWVAFETMPEYAKVKGAMLLFENVVWDMAAGDMAALAARSGRLRDIRWALVSSDLLSYGMLRTFAAQTEGKGEFQVFRDSEAALNWLNEVFPAPMQESTAG